MLSLKSKFTETDSELARFARILALPVRVYIVRMIIENGNSISKKEICDGPFEMENLLKHMAELKLTGIIKASGTKADTIYSIDIALFNQMVSRFFSLFDHLNSIAQFPHVHLANGNGGDAIHEKSTESTDSLNFGAFIKKHRLALKISQEELSRKTKIDRAELSRIECGKKSPGPEKLISLSKALYIDLDSLTKEYYSSRIVNIVAESGFSDVILKNVLTRLNYFLPAV
ncbi:helix-turn-helix transcriptional regulator [Mucilaginibacter rubeus]|uniref:Helix-turn-helix transcriptional regulator n=1 Tax=Mucilaginibacter rubeus TaxID=2027860 RepID=A0AAE6JKZ3_9SPHI|nr:MULTISPECIES: helix-turn-helix transcriptional regulator [Mucilaginibacter]QEM06467.1 helix-turn-helix transcriptional regulator [Mucilaginibacter rubeus]QEM19053.1 helix-turn-helix transcriptional regulator [Mucilaginibacter gossypii]QTE44406.1 helix-turn-helix transcriptional regulator [Mucilaginibacter rubeus]QTE51005.1 helix-turn-helix transcriptional regulator [Mucilaginibacter rubeus]QTE56088.1 helix-turn-helix transcriptional regulator [Mucilaginibacter rubeus]